MNDVSFGLIFTTVFFLVWTGAAIGIIRAKIRFIRTGNAGGWNQSWVVLVIICFVALLSVSFLIGTWSDFITKGQDKDWLHQHGKAIQADFKKIERTGMNEPGTAIFYKLTCSWNGKTFVLENIEDQYLKDFDQRKKITVLIDPKKPTMKYCIDLTALANK